MLTPRPLTSLLLAIVALTGCSDRPDPRALGEANRCSLADGPRLTIGGVEPPAHIFGSVVAGTRLDDGRIAVIDRQARSVSVFSEDGVLLQTLGREGEGPGEFLDPITIVSRGNTLTVRDWRQPRLTTFDLETDETTTLPLEGIINPTAHLGDLPDGWVLGSEAIEPEGVGGLMNTRLHVLEFNTAGAITDTITSFVSRVRGWVDESTRLTGSPTFGPRGSFAARDARVYWTHGDSAVVRKFEDGAVRPIQWEWPVRRVSEGDVEAYRDQWIAAQPRGETTIRQTIEAMPVAETFPVVANLVADVADGVWAEIYAMPGDTLETWLHLTEEGVRCRVDLPRSFTMLEAAGDWILGSFTDDLGVQTVQLWELGS
ncbi:MAG: 6-bladed beta-propeller [Gemmatimonadetes bacterium]|nr:6-bladed beta-propeller [Gemmatimonadota bacterium]